MLILWRDQIGIRTHLQAPPYSVICDRRAHIYIYEASGMAFHSGAHVVTIDPTHHNNSHLTADMIRKELVLDDDVHHSPTGLICLENTMNGEVFPFDEMECVFYICTLFKHLIRVYVIG